MNEQQLSPVRAALSHVGFEWAVDAYEEGLIAWEEAMVKLGATLEELPTREALLEARGAELALNDAVVAGKNEVERKARLILAQQADHAWSKYWMRFQESQDNLRLYRQQVEAAEKRIALWKRIMDWEITLKRGGE